MRCRLCYKDAIAVFLMDKGCFCCPDTEQALCSSHITSSEPFGSMELKEVLIPEIWDWLEEIECRR